MARRPDLKRPGVTATGRQWQTIEALRADGWFVLEADPMLWSDVDRERVRQAVMDCQGEGSECYVHGDACAQIDGGGTDGEQ